MRRVPAFFADFLAFFAVFFAAFFEAFFFAAMVGSLVVTLLMSESSQGAGVTKRSATEVVHLSASEEKPLDRKDSSRPNSADGEIARERETERRLRTLRHRDHP